VTGTNAGRVAEVFGADPASEIIATALEARDRLGSREVETAGNEVVQIGELGGCIVAIEPLGFTGSEDAVACELSRDGACAALLVTFYSASMFIYAVRGELVRRLSIKLYGWELDYGNGLAEEEDLPFGDDEGSHYAAALLLIERLTGPRLEREWVLEQRRPAYRRAALPG